MKYPKTLHLPYSPGIGTGDKIAGSYNHFNDKEVIYTEKLDGENTSLHRDSIHARSENQTDHPSRSLVKKLHGSISYLIPEHLQIVGENVYAEHSIRYDQLTDFFYVTAVIDKVQGKVLSVEDTLYWCEVLNLKFVPILYWGPFERVDQAPSHSCFGDRIEGYVVRTVGEFNVEDFDKNVAKWVRPNHVQTDVHWKQHWRPNVLHPSADLWYA